MEEKQSNEHASSKQKVVICGGGNAAHVFFGLSALSSNNDCYLFSLFRTEAADFKKSVIANKNKLIIELTQNDHQKLEATINPENVTNDPKCLQNADIIIVSLPAFAHAQYLSEIAKNVGNHKCLVAVFPGASGIECDWHHMIMPSDSCKYGAKQYTLYSCITLPWAARIQTFGKYVEILGTKTSVQGSFYPKLDVLQLNALKGIINIAKRCELADYGHILNMSLGAMNAIIHPSIMYAQWKDWDGKAMKEKPQFYHGISRYGAQLLSKISDECALISKCIRNETKLNTVRYRHVFEVYKRWYADQSTDLSSLYGIITTNKAYDGLVHPMKAYDDGKECDLYVPNFRYRYLSEDIPYGMIVIKGLAMILKDVPETPNLDLVIEWAQKVMNKQYLVYDSNNGTVKAGKDINQTRAPQKYNFNKIEQLV